MGGRRRRVEMIPAKQFAVVGANIRALRLRKGWTQAELGELMGWPTTSTVCAAEGHRDGVRLSEGCDISGCSGHAVSLRSGMLAGS